MSTKEHSRQIIMHLKRLMNKSSNSCIYVLPPFPHPLHADTHMHTHCPKHHLKTMTSHIRYLCTYLQSSMDAMPLTKIKSISTFTLDHTTVCLHLYTMHTRCITYTEDIKIEPIINIHTIAMHMLYIKVEIQIRTYAL